MSIWTALLPGDEAGVAQVEQVDSQGLPALPLAWWCLQYTPRVALLEEAVVMEWQASERLFGGRRALLRRLAAGAQQGGCRAWASASTALAALALARARSLNPARKPRSLDDLPLSCLSAMAAHEATLSRLGCRTLGDVRQLPRDGLSRRLGAAPLKALDQALGQQAEVLTWVTLPEVFDERLELPGRVDNAPALQHAADALLARLCAWLAGRHMGVSQLTLRWQHDGQRRDAERGGQWPVRLASPCRDGKQLRSLVAEHLRRITLIAPVGELALRADVIEPLNAPSEDLFSIGDASQQLLQPDALRTPAAQRQQAQTWSGLLDKLAARLGAERVLQGQEHADHRLEHAQVWGHWNPLEGTAAAAKRMPSPEKTPSTTQCIEPQHQHQHHHALPSPSWLLPTPLPLSLHRSGPGLPERPYYQGPLTLLAGPHRVDAGWWDGVGATPPASRDYYLASSEQAGLLWVFKDRQASHAENSASAQSAAHSPWFLHGIFA